MEETEEKNKAIRQVQISSEEASHGKILTELKWGKNLAHRQKKTLKTKLHNTDSP